MTVPEALLLLLVEFHPCFTRPGFAHFSDFVLGHSCLWAGPHTVTEIMRFVGSHVGRHWTTPYAFLGRGRWSPRDVFIVLLKLVCRLLGITDQIILGLDDTLAKKWGRFIAATGYYPDPTDKNPGAEKRKVLGHCWVVACVLSERSAGRWMALPFASLLFIPEAKAKECERPFAGKVELAVRLVRWVKDNLDLKITVVVDNLYAKGVFLTLWPDLILISRLKSNAALYLPPTPKASGQRGRPAKRGQKVTAEELWQSGKRRRKLRVSIYGKQVTVTAWVGKLIPSRTLSDKPILAIITPSRDAKRMLVFFSSDTSMSPERVLEIYGGRFKIEDAFDEMKTWGGFEDCRLRKVEAIEKHACLSLVSHTLLKLASLDEKVAERVEEDPWWRPKGVPSATRMRRRCHKDFLFSCSLVPEPQTHEIPLESEAA